MRYRPEVIGARLTAFEHNAELYTTENFSARAVVFDMIQQVHQLLSLHRRDPTWGRYRRVLGQQAERIETRLRQADADLFHGLRCRIRRGAYRPNALRQLFNRYTQYRPGRMGQMHRGYDDLDALVQGLTWVETIPDVLPARYADMVPYEPTPARVILDLIDQVSLSTDDVFYDLGSGLGHVTILAHLVTGATAIGVEIEASYCLHAERRAAALGLSKLRFSNLDARDAHYAGGRVFFMYTPFTGEILATVLDILAQEARRRPIVICTYGACTFEVMTQPWLRLRDDGMKQIYALAVFDSTG